MMILGPINHKVFIYIRIVILISNLHSSFWNRFSQMPIQVFRSPKVQKKLSQSSTPKWKCWIGILFLMVILIPVICWVMQARALYQMEMNTENTLHMIFSKRLKDKTSHFIGNSVVNGSSVIANTTAI